MRAEFAENLVVELSVRIVSFERGYDETWCALEMTKSDEGFGFRTFVLPDGSGYRIMDIVPDLPLDRFNATADVPIVASSIIREVNGVTDPSEMLTELDKGRVKLRVLVPPSHPPSATTSAGSSDNDSSPCDSPSISCGTPTISPRGA
jgi:hypothetical protein